MHLLIFYLETDIFSADLCIEYFLRQNLISFFYMLQIHFYNNKMMVYRYNLLNTFIKTGVLHTVYRLIISTVLKGRFHYPILQVRKQTQRPKTI
jgi:hypothetical protein